MKSLQEARDLVQEAAAALSPVEVPVREALGLVLAEAVVSDQPVPPFPNTAMDGFAVRAADTEEARPDAPVELPIVETVAAGSVASRPLEAGEAMRIMTGAPLPDGADAIIKVELTRPSHTGESGSGESGSGESVPDRVQLLDRVLVGNHVRRAGEDIEAGAGVLSAGTLLGPGHLGVLASVGRQRVRCHPRPRVGVFSTGDELIDGPEALLPGQIRDSNRPVLLAMVTEAGGEPVDLGLQPDDEEAIEGALRDGAASCDMVLTSGGVSMGDFDYVKAVLTRLGGFTWMQVAIKPAKPLVYGQLDGTPIFGLPGNPVSSMVSFELFARPVIRAMAGHADTERPRLRAVTGEDLDRRPDGKVHFNRVAVTGHRGSYVIRRTGGQGSHQLLAMALANGLAVLPDGEGVAAGELVEVLQVGPIS